MYEVELAPPVYNWAEHRGYTVWSEVMNKCVRKHRTVDIVIKSKKMFWSLELKTTLNFEVIAQAKRNIPYFNISCVVVPAVKKITKGRKLAYELLNSLGIGLIEIFPDTSGGLTIPNDQPFTIKPKINKKRTIDGLRNVEKWLKEEQKKSIAGVATSASFSIKRKALSQIEEALKINGVLTIEDAYELTQWYFKNTKQCFRSISNYGGKFSRIIVDDGITYFEYINKEE